MKSLTIILLILFACVNNTQAQDELIGYWLRVDDRVLNPTDEGTPTQDSTIIEVKYLDGELTGTLIKVPRTSNDWGYFVGQKKWKNMTKLNERKFEAYGLLMEQGNTQVFDVPTYIKVFMDLTDEKHTINLWTENQGNRFNWAKQKWIRLPNS